MSDAQGKFFGELVDANKKAEAAYKEFWEQVGGAKKVDHASLRNHLLKIFKAQDNQLLDQQNRIVATLLAGAQVIKTVGTSADAAEREWQRRLANEATERAIALKHEWIDWGHRCGRWLLGGIAVVLVYSALVNAALHWCWLRIPVHEWFVMMAK